MTVSTPGAPLVRRHGEQSYPAGAAITAGQLVYVDTSGNAQIAGANAKNIVGVCLVSCDTDADIAADSPLLAAPAADRCQVGAHGEYRVTYAAAAHVGDKLVAAASGQVTPYTSGSSTYDEIVGYCTQAMSAGGVGRAYIRP